jgi:hypothetical protein
LSLKENGAREMGFPHAKGCMGPLCYIKTRINPKCMKDVNVRPETINVQKKMELKLHSLDLTMSFECHTQISGYKISQSINK